VYVVVAPTVRADARPTSSTGRTGWRSRRVPERAAEERPVAAPDEEASAPSEAPAETGAPEADDELVLEQETEDGELTELVDRPDQRES
jgi:hypothetical protein